MKRRASPPRPASRGVLSVRLPGAKVSVCQDAPSGWALSRDSSYRTPGPLSVLPKQRQQWTRLRMLSSAQRAPRDLLPSPLPGGWRVQQRGWRQPGPLALHPSAHPKGELRGVGQSLPVPLLVSRHVLWWERGTGACRGARDVTRSGFCSPRSFHGLCPRKNCHQQEMNSSICLLSTVSSWWVWRQRRMLPTVTPTTKSWQQKQSRWKFILPLWTRHWIPMSESFCVWNSPLPALEF